MRKRAARIIALMLCLLLAAGTASFAASVVSPAANSIIYSDSMLVSVKVTDKATIRVTVYEEKQKDASGTLVSVDVADMTSSDLSSLDSKKYTDSVFSTAATYTNTGDVGFYTKQLTNVKPGLYKVKVETLGENDSVVSTISCFTAVKQKEEKQDQNIFQNQTTTALQFIQNLIKKVFK